MTDARELETHLAAVAALAQLFKALWLVRPPADFQESIPWIAGARNLGLVRGDVLTDMGRAALKLAGDTNAD